MLGFPGSQGTFIKRPFRRPLELGRCETDGGLVVYGSQASLETHGGHRIRTLMRMTLWEIFAVWVGIVHE